MLIKIKKISENATIPSIGNPMDACFDLYALEDTEFNPFEIKLVKTGIAIELPENFRSNIYVRSSTPLKKNFILANGTGIIDNGYRGELMIQLLNIASIFNEGQVSFIKNKISKGDKIAQLEIVQAIPAGSFEIKVFDTLSSTVRGDGGFGSTG